MSPFEVIDELDPLTSMIEFRTSAVYELVIGIRTLIQHPHWHEAWCERAQSALSPALYDELVYLYKNFNDGALYFELPVDYPDHSDVPGFFKYVRQLSPSDFVFYLLGRILSRETLLPLFKKRSGERVDAIRAALSAYAQEEHYSWYAENLEPALADIEGFRDRLVNAWEMYWKVFFKGEIAALEPIWDSGINDKRRILEREGGRALMEKVTGKAMLPPELPPGMPITSITFIPVVLLPSRVYKFFGYGDTTNLFDPQLTEERKLAAEQSRKDAAATLKALEDETRLKILRMIAQHEGHLHGKLIAEKLEISASAVSRHLALLKDGNLIAEEPHKNLITYRFKKETLTGLLDKLFEYLYS